MLNAQSISDYLKHRHCSRKSGIAAYWLDAANSRSELVSSISSLTSGLPILTVAVPKGAFDDPNGISDDLVRTISDNVKWFCEKNRNSIVRERKFSLVLISKRPLNIPQLSSPVTLPDWFPLWASTLLTATIESITNSVDISLASPDIPIASINSSLHELEIALCDRLEDVYKKAPSAATPLLIRIGGKKGAADLALLVNQSKIYRDKTSPADFRPGGSAKSHFLVSHLFRQWWECSHNDLHSLAVDFADALGIQSSTAIETQYALSTLLTRTVKPPLSETPPGVTFARNVLVSLSHVIQLTNATHHAGDYPNFPALLTINFARDLDRSCKCAADALVAMT